jgi:multiple sugar transport system permease protein
MRTTQGTSGDAARRADRERRVGEPKGSIPARLLDARLGDYLFVVPALVFVALLMLYPLLYSVNLSLRDVNIGNILAGGAPFVGLENYAAALGDPAVRQAFVTSLVYTGSSILISFVFGFALALFFDKAFPSSGTMRAMLLLGYVLPTVVSGNVWRWMLAGDDGIVNYVLERLGLISDPIFWLTEARTALIGVIAATVWVTTPLAMILLLAGLQGISPSVYEAAKVDGAGPWRRFLHITLPLMRPVSLTVVLLSFILTFKTFDNVYVMTRGGPGDATNIAPIQAYRVTFEFFRFGEGAVITNLLLAISLVLALVYLWVSRREEGA